MKIKQKLNTIPIINELLNIITPMGLEIKRNSLVIGEIQVKFMA